MEDPDATCVDEAEDEARHLWTGDQLRQVPQFLRVGGDLDVDAAAAHYRQALTLTEELGMRPLQAHCHRGLGTLYATTGQRQQAGAELSTAIAMYQSIDMTFWLPQAEAALAQVT